MRWHGDSYAEWIDHGCHAHEHTRDGACYTPVHWEWAHDTYIAWDRVRRALEEYPEIAPYVTDPRP
jgi:hypothetical protein